MTDPLLPTQAIRAVVLDYLEGMIWGDTDRLARAFHPGAIQLGHAGEEFEFLSASGFIDWVRAAQTEPAGTPYEARLIQIDITGTVAVAKLWDRCFGADFTDYLVLVNDRPDATGRWQIVTKAFHMHGPQG